MSGTVQASGIDEVIVKFQTLGSHARQRLEAAVYVQALEVQRIVQEEKLSGGVLNVRTGRLRDSIHTELESSADRILAVVGTDVVYARIHEYGGVIKHPGGTAYIPKAGGLMEFVSNAAAGAWTLPRTAPHEIPMPARSFLRSTLAERQDAIRAALLAAVTGAA